MFCPECGANQPDGTSFCAECGASLGAPQPAAQPVVQNEAPAYQAQPVYQAQPAYQAQPVYQVPGQPNYYAAPVNPLSKGEYLKQKATSGTKLASKLVLLVLVACIVIMVLGHVSLMNTSLEDIPVVSFAFEMADVDEDEFDELKDELENELEIIEKEFEYYEDELEDELSKKDMKKLEELLDVMKDCTKTISINNLKSMLALTAELADSDVGDYLDLDIDSELEEISTVMSGLTTGLLFASIFSLLFTIIGALTRVNALVVLGAIGSAIFCAVLYGVLYVVLILVAHIAMIVMLSKVNKEYKAYRNGALPAAA